MESVTHDSAALSLRTIFGYPQDRRFGGTQSRGVQAVVMRKGPSSAASSQQPVTLLTELPWLINISKRKVH
jgi:hypothetical protein